MSYLFKSSADSAPKDKWIAYRENGEVKYMHPDSDEAQDFSATGGVAKGRKTSAWANMTSEVGYMAQPPQLLPQRYTDDSVVPVVVTNVVSYKNPVIEEKKSFMDKFKKNKVPSTTRTVWMPRRDYKKYFAKDKDGKYIGTEPQREWTDDELEDMFGQYHKEL